MYVVVFPIFGSMVVVSPKLIKLFGHIARMKIDAIALFPFIVVASTKAANNKVLINHERIHLRQQLELLLLPFYIWYAVAYFRKTYRGISFEREAYANENDLFYLSRRKPFAFFRYVL